MEQKIPDCKACLRLAWAQLEAQEQADAQQKPMCVLAGEGEGVFLVLSQEECSGRSVLYTAYPTIYEELDLRHGVAYNCYTVRFTNIRKLLDDDGEEVEIEEIVGEWSVEHAQRVRAFLNRVLPYDESKQREMHRRKDFFRRLFLW
jgi:hypothetical protein